MAILFPSEIRAFSIFQRSLQERILWMERLSRHSCAASVMRSSLAIRSKKNGWWRSQIYQMISRQTYIARCSDQLKRPHCDARHTAHWKGEGEDCSTFIAMLFRSNSKPKKKTCSTFPEEVWAFEKSAFFCTGITVSLVQFAFFQLKTLVIWAL